MYNGTSWIMGGNPTLFSERNGEKIIVFLGAFLGTCL